MKIEAHSDFLHTGENNSRSIFITVDEKYSDKSIRLSFVTPLGRMYITDMLEVTSEGYNYFIPDILLDGKGRLYVQIIVSDSDGFTAKSKIEEIPVFAALDDMNNPALSGDELKSIAVICDELIKKADKDHLHEGIYCTEDGVRELLSAKSDKGHLHNGIYLTRDEIAAMIDERDADSHNHDDRYYKKSETDSLLSKKSSTSHSHSYSSLTGKPEINGIEITENTSVDGLMFRRLLTSADDCDKLFEDGVYVYSTSSPPKNAPFPNASVIEVFGAKSTSTQKIQRAYRYGEPGYSAFRPLYSGNWSGWTQTSPIITVTEKTVTTNANGNAQLTGDKSKSVIVMAYAITGDGASAYRCDIYSSASMGGWFCHVSEISSGNAVASKTLNVTFYSISL